MEKIDTKKLDVDFTQAVKDFKAVIKKSSSCRCGNEPDAGVPRRKIIDLFAGSPKTSRVSLLFTLVTILAVPAYGDESERLNSWMLRLLFEITEELEKV